MNDEILFSLDTGGGHLSGVYGNGMVQRCVFAAFMATIVYVFVSVFKGFKKKKPGADLDELAKQE